MKQASDVTAMINAGFPAWACSKWLEYMIELGYDNPLTDSFDYPCFLAENKDDVSSFFDSHGEDNMECIHSPGYSNYEEYWANLSDDGGPTIYFQFEHGV